MIIEELAVALGIRFSGKDKSDLESFKKGVREAGKDLAKLGAIAAGVAAGIGALVAKISSMNDHLGRSAKVLGISADELGNFKDAMSVLTNGSADGISMLKNMQAAAVEAARSGGSAAAAYAMFGVSVVDAAGNAKTANQLFMELSDRLKGMDPNDLQLNWGLQQLGLMEFKGILLDGTFRKAMQDVKEFGVTQAQTDRARKFEAALTSMGLVFRWMGNIFNDEIQPAITEIIESFMAWARANKEWLKTNIKDAAQAFVKVLKALADTVAFLWPIFKKFVDIVGAQNIVWISMAAWLGLVTLSLARLAFWIGAVIGRITSMAVVVKGWNLVVAALRLSVAQISQWIMTAGGWIARLGPLLTSFAAWVSGAWAAVVAAFESFMAVMTALAAGAAGTVAVVVMAIGALIAVVWDAWKAFKGGDSVIGRLRQAFPAIAAVLDSLISPVVAVVNVLKLLWNILTAFFSGDIDKNLREAFSIFYEDMANTLDLFLAPFKTVFEYLQKAWEWLGGSAAIKKSIILAQEVSNSGATAPRFAANTGAASIEAAKVERSVSVSNSSSKKVEYMGRVDFNVNVTGDAKNLDKAEMAKYLNDYVNNQSQIVMQNLTSTKRQ